MPTDLVRDPAAIDYDRILSDERMRERVDPDMSEGARLTPACEDEGTGSAEPARRIVEVARDLGGAATVQSICNESFTSALDGITSQLARVIRRRRCRGADDGGS